MKQNAIAPFRLVKPGLELSAGTLNRLMENPGFAAFLDMLSNAVLVLGADGRIIAINQAAEAMLGLPSTAARNGQSDALPEGLAAAFKAMTSRVTSGIFRMPLQMGNGQTALSAILHVLPCEAGQKAVRIVTLDAGTGEPSTMFQEQSGSPLQQANGPLLYQARLEPLIELGVKAFRSRRRILLLGETGVGKTTLVKSMHRQVHGPSRPFIHVNCSSISESLFEAEMFGYERGAFTGALAGGKAGFIEAANGGTLFLDEVGELALHQQAKLLKFLEDGTIQPVGSVKPKQVDTYVVCATNRDLWQEVQEKRFREDLYYRIAMIPVEVPALRQHQEELPALIDTLVANLNLGRPRKLVLTPECRKALIAHDYPGNMRELVGIIARLDLLAEENAGIDLLPSNMTGAGQRTGKTETVPPASGTLKEQVRAFERRLIDEALRGAHSKRQAARALGIDIASLLRKLQDH